MQPILRQTWWIVLIQALVMAATCYFCLPNKALHDWGVNNPYASFVIQSFVYLAGLVMSIVVTACFWKVINGKKWKTNLLRTLVVALISFAIGAVAGTVFQLVGNWLTTTPALSDEMPSTESMMTTWVFVSIAIMLVLVVVLTPFSYAFTRYMIAGKRLPWKGYGVGFKYWGTLFLTQLLAGIIVGVILAAISLPLDILIASQLLSQLGALDGDSLGIPSYFTPLLLIALAVFWYVATYAVLWVEVVFTYQYGSIETQQREKKLQKA